MKTITSLLTVITIALVFGCSTTAPVSNGVDASPIPRPPPSSNPFKQDPKAIATVKKRGARTAAADINAGRLRILVYGGAANLPNDPATGFLAIPVMCCDMSGQVSAETDAYNEVMRSWHAKHLKTQTPE